MEKEKISFSKNFFRAMNALGYSPNESLVILIFTNFLDGANCLALSETQVGEVLGVCRKTISRTMVKLLEQNEVAKRGARYDFTKFLGTIKKVENVLDKNNGKG